MIQQNEIKDFEIFTDYISYGPKDIDNGDWYWFLSFMVEYMAHSTQKKMPDKHKVL